ncbi:hypothetical protein Hanom_Chr05g00407211 [Helianthus anomalus]
MKMSEFVSMVFIIWLTYSSEVVEPRDFMTWMSSAPEILPFRWCHTRRHLQPPSLSFPVSTPTTKYVVFDAPELDLRNDESGRKYLQGVKMVFFNWLINCSCFGFIGS